MVKYMFYLSISKGDDDPQVAKVFDTGDIWGWLEAHDDLGSV